MTTQAQAEHRAAFYADLRGDKFTQGTGNLRYRDRADDKIKHCCLGVGQERYQNDPDVVPDTFQYRYDFCARPNEEYVAGSPYGALSPGAQEYYGFPGGNPDLRAHSNGRHMTAAEWNDQARTTFAEIADMFEAEFPAVANE